MPLGVPDCTHGLHLAGFRLPPLGLLVAAPEGKWSRAGSMVVPHLRDDCGGKKTKGFTNPTPPSTFSEGTWTLQTHITVSPITFSEGM